MKKVFIVVLLFFSSLSYSQNSNFTILCIAAHPDDEDGATLAYYSKLYGYQAYTIFYTKGEGGQNEIGPQLYDELGKLREQECYDAAAVQGSTAYFLGQLDFGFSKTAKETFKFWGGEDSVLARIVYMIRALKPDVIISNHDTITIKPNRQHGNHQVCGITAYDAFDKAADPNYHPEQLVNGIEPWQVKKLFFRTYDTTKTDVFTVDISQRDPASGKSIREITDEALSKHRTQGMDKVDKNSPFFYANKKYELVRSDKMYPVEGNDLFAGLIPGIKPDITLNSYKTIYNYLPRKNLNPADFTFDRSTKIGLVKTYDNSIEDFFKEFDINYTLIDSLSIANNTFVINDVVILDLRAYLYRNDALYYKDIILDYVKKGGNVICFYNKPSDWNIGRDLAPYPITISALRVTEEDAPVTVLEPQHDYFNIPNQMLPIDWDGWVQERNVYLPLLVTDDITFSDNYHKLLAMQDEDDPVPSTSLLWAEYGTGTYTYCSLALYRQLKILNSGAVKLFLNMLSQKHHQQIKH